MRIDMTDKKSIRRPNTYKDRYTAVKRRIQKQTQSTDIQAGRQTQRGKKCSYNYSCGVVNENWLGTYEKNHTDVVLAVLVEDVLQLDVGTEVLHEVFVDGGNVDVCVVTNLSTNKQTLKII